MIQGSQSNSIVAWIAPIDSTPIGPLWVAVSPDGLAAVEFNTEKTTFIQELKRRGFQEVLEGLAETADAREQISAYLRGDRREFNLPIDWRGVGQFQHQALTHTLAVPYGQLTTYAAIAQALGKPGAARAVGRAEATNPFPLVIPCHRVVGSDGGLHGYGAPGGIQTKAWLLKLEGARD